MRVARELALASRETTSQGSKRAGLPCAFGPQPSPMCESRTSVSSRRRIGAGRAHRWRGAGGTGVVPISSASSSRTRSRTIASRCGTSPPTQRWSATGVLAERGRTGER